MNNKDFDTIKKLYGEDFAKFCRTHLARIMSEEGKLPEILQSKIHPTKRLMDSIKENHSEGEFISYILRVFVGDTPSEHKTQAETPTPKELMDKAGYILYECKTVEDINAFKKYYARGEKLCTFDSPGLRLQNNHVFWAVKKDVDKIKREDFTKPEREDEYGTSVISLQFRKDNHTLSIKNRYNHAVDYCDDTFSSNLENIIEGLTDSFDVHYGIREDLSTKKLDLDDFVLGSDGKHYQFNVEQNNTYYCNDNIIIDNNWTGNNVKQYDKSRFEVFDIYILDKKEKKIFAHPSLEDKEDTTMTSLYLENVEVVKIKGTSDKIIKLSTTEGHHFEIKINNQSQITEFFSDIEECHSNFLRYSSNLKKCDLPNLKFMGECSLEWARNLEEINMPNIEIIKPRCMTFSGKIRKLKLTKLKEMGDEVLQNATWIQEFYAPELEELGEYCFSFCTNLTDVSIPKVRVIKKYSFSYVDKLQKFDAPNIEEIKHGSLTAMGNLEKLDFPNLRAIGQDVFRTSLGLKKVHLPNLELMPSGHFQYVPNLKEVYLPKVEKIGVQSFDKHSIEKLDLPNVQEISGASFQNNHLLKEINMPKLKYIGAECFQSCDVLESLNLPNLEEMGHSTFQNLPKLALLNMPHIKRISHCCFKDVNSLQELSLPLAQSLGIECFQDAQNLQTLDLSNAESLDIDCFKNAPELKNLNLSKLKILQQGVFAKSANLQKVVAPSVESMATNSLGSGKLNKKYIADFEMSDNLKERLETRSKIPTRTEDNSRKSTRKEKRSLFARIFGRIKEEKQFAYVNNRRLRKELQQEVNRERHETEERKAEIIKQDIKDHLENQRPQYLKQEIDDVDDWQDDISKQKEEEKEFDIKNNLESQRPLEQTDVVMDILQEKEQKESKKPKIKNKINDIGMEK